MISVHRLEEWRGHQVLDQSGVQLGKLEDVYFDAGTGTPLLLAVKSGLLGRKLHLIPVDEAKVGPDYVRVAFAKDAVDRAGVSDGVPDTEQLRDIGAAYGLAFSDRVSLQSATEQDAHRAEAQAAGARADELEAAAQEKISAQETAHEHAQGATEHATQAEREAEQARQAALDARQDADRYEGG
jgi:sporulation protein YlmC with PRC-barrel domain